MINAAVRGTALTVALGLVSAAPLDAQVLQRPQRAADRPQPASERTRPTQSFVFTLDALGGYDSNLVVLDANVAASVDVPFTSTPGYLGQMDAGFEFRRNQGDGFIEADAHGLLSDFSADGAVPQNASLGASRSANAGVGFGLPLGRQSLLTGTQRFYYETLYNLSEFAALGPESEELPTAPELQGVLRSDSWVSASGVGLSRRWTPRNTTSISYQYDRRRYIDEDLVADAHNVSAYYERLVGRRAAVRTTYNFTDSRFPEDFELGRLRPYTSHGIDIGPRFVRRVSPRRTLEVSMAAGATYVKSLLGLDRVPYDYWAPYGAFSTRLDIGRTWVLSGNYRRAVTAFEGLTVETYLSDVVGVSTGGELTNRLSTVLTAGFADGAVHGAEGGQNNYTTLSGAAQLRFILTRRLSTVAQYSFYHYEFSTGTDLPGGFPPEFDRHSFRVGLTVRLPIGRNADPGFIPARGR